jgi:hypothetical protein
LAGSVSGNQFPLRQRSAGDHNFRFCTFAALMKSRNPFLHPFIFAGFLLLSSGFTSAQPAVPRDPAALKKVEDTLRVLCDSMLDSADEMIRQSSCYNFIKTMVRALKEPASFDYPFESLNRISILKPDDAKFRIMTWALRYNDGRFRFYGTIQMNKPGELVMFPLYDYSPFATLPADSLYSHEKWLGALYYRMLPVKNSSGKTYYTLFGWDGNTDTSNRKVIEVLSFNSKGHPVFGASLFDFGSRDPRNKKKRYLIEYKEDATVSLNYDSDLQLIIADHLQPETPATQDDHTTYIPDGTYEGFRWENGKWRYIENVFTSTQAEPPFPDPVDFEKRKNNSPRY